jgi:LuxR family maltose regulon positive regulatory protein
LFRRHHPHRPPRFTCGTIQRMSASLLTTKITLPLLRSNLVARPRLVERLEAGWRQGRVVTLVAAPAGYGKTTLLRSWLEPHAARAAWVTLDATDSQPSHFWSYVIATLQTIETEIGRDLQQVLHARRFQATPLAADEFETGLAALINDLAQLPDRLILILDDYHLIESHDIQRQVAFVIDHLPPALHLVFATRADPLDLPIARLRARQQLTELRADDLRFTPEESAAFLNEAMSLRLTRDDVLALEARTEGWIAGLQLAALALPGPLSRPGRSDVQQFLQAFTGTHRFIVDYLIEEVLRRQPTDVQDFLLQTSILDRLCGDLCDALTQQSGGAARLDRLAAENLFLAPLDDQRAWYRYHQLFADLLRARLEHSQPERVSELQRRAAQWYLDHALYPEAVAHALASQDVAWAATVIETAGEVWLLRSELVTVSAWLNALPPDVVRLQPRLSVLRVWVQLVSGQPQDTIAGRHDLTAWLETHAADPLAPLIHAEVTAIDAYAARLRGDFLRAIDLSQQALAQLPDNDHLRGLIAFNLGMAQSNSGNLSEAHAAFETAAQFSEQAGDYEMMLLALTSAAQVQRERGQLRAAEQSCRRVLDLAGGDAAWSPMVSFALIALGNVLYQWNDLAAADDLLGRGVQLAQRGGNAELLIAGYASLLWLRRAQGDRPGTQEVMNTLLHITLQHHTPRLDELAAFYRAWLALDDRDLRPAQEWLELTGRTVDDPIDLAHLLDYTVLARVQLASGQPDRSLRLLERLSSLAESAGHGRSLIELLVLTARAHDANGDHAQARATLLRAIELAEPEGYMRAFVDEDVQLLLADCRVLIDKRSDRTRLLTYLDRLLVAFPISETSCQQLAAGNPAGALRGQPPALLSDRELEVLRLIAAGQSNEEIAAQLIISLGTVKAHTSNIYRKLDVRGRAQAIVKAQELNLL